MKVKLVKAVIVIVFLFAGCKSSETPTEPPKVNPPPIDTLIDPTIKPKVLSIFPPANSEGPYQGFFPANQSQLQVRFNKKMDIPSVRQAIGISSSAGNIRADTTLFNTIGGTLFTITPVDSLHHLLKRWPVGQVYIFTISSMAKDINGNQILPPFTMNFTPEPWFRIAAATESLKINSPFVISFNSPVDTNIYSSIRFTPPATCSWYLTADSMSAHAYPITLPPTDSAYTVTVTPDAHDKFGNYLQEAYTSSFTLLQNAGFHIVTALPNLNASSLFQQVYIGCSGLIDTESIKPAFHISPIIPGTFFISGEVYFNYTPSRNYISETTYTVTIDSTLREQGGSGLPASYRFTFTTPPFLVQSISPADSQTSVSTKTPVYLTFNAYIDYGSVPSSFSIVDQSNNPVDGSFIIFSSGFSFEPSSGLKPKTSYHVTISSALQTPEGYHLRVPVSVTFTTGS